MSQGNPPGNHQFHPGPNSGSGFAQSVRENSEILYGTLAWFFVAGLAVVLRVFIRTRLIKNFGWDDAAMVLAMISYTVFMAVLVVVVHWARHRDELATGMSLMPSDDDPHQVGKRDNTTGITYNVGSHNPLDELFHSRLLWQVQSCLYLGTIWLTRSSVGMLFLCVIPEGTKTWARVTIRVLLWLTFLGFTVTLIINLFECLPIGSTPGASNTECMPRHVLPWSIIIYSVLSLIIDFSFALLPLAVLWGVVMRPADKMGAIFLMSLGCIASASVIYRLVVLDAASFLELETGHLTADPVKLQIQMLVSWTIEMAGGIAGGSIATFKPLFKWIIDVYQSFVPAMGIVRNRRRRPDPTTIPDSYPAPLGTPETPMTPGNNAYSRRMAQYQNGQEFELVSNGSTLSTSAPSHRSVSPLPAEPESTPMSPTFPEYVRVSSKQTLISPVRVATTPTRSTSIPLSRTFVGQIPSGRFPESDPEQGLETEDDDFDFDTELPNSPTPSPRGRDFGTALPTIFSGQVLDFTQSHTQSTRQSLPADCGDLFHGMPATLTESTVNSNGSGESFESPWAC